MCHYDVGFNSAVVGWFLVFLAALLYDPPKWLEVFQDRDTKAFFARNDKPERIISEQKIEYKLEFRGANHIVSLRRWALMTRAACLSMF